MFICFELLILCLCFDVKIAFPIDPISNVHLHTHCTQLAVHKHTHTHTFTNMIYTQHLAISLRVIVIFVEYDFICCCHYAVDAIAAAGACRQFDYLIQNTNCFPIFCHFNSNVAIADWEEERQIKIGFANTLSLPVIDGDIRNVRSMESYWCCNKPKYSANFTYKWEYMSAHFV